MALSPEVLTAEKCVASDLLQKNEELEFINDLSIYKQTISRL